MNRSSLDFFLTTVNDPTLLYANEWLTFARGKVYIRVSQRIFAGEQHKCIDVATVEWPEKLRGQGRFAAMLDSIRKACQFPIYVENVLEPRLAAYLERRGFSRLPSDPFFTDAPPCFILFGPLQQP